MKLLKALASLPLRERGLKLSPEVPLFFIIPVAPPAGAWIETTQQRDTPSVDFVAPPAGAWIETMLPGVCKRTIESRSPCGSVD